MKRTIAAVAALMCVAFSAPAQSQQAITLHGAVQFNDDHAFNKALLKFEELVKKYYGKPINFVLHRTASSGWRSSISNTWRRARRSTTASSRRRTCRPSRRRRRSSMRRSCSATSTHWNKVLDADVLKPIADEIAQKADVMLIGYAGGGVRNIFVNKPVRNPGRDEGPQGPRAGRADLESKTFQAAGMAPTVIAYNEVYNAIQNGVIAAGENEAAGVESMKFYEVAPHLAMTEHAITIRPICFSGKTFKRLPADLQDAILKAGKEAGAHGRQIESSEDAQKLDALEKAGKLKRIPFADRAEMKKLVDPVMAAYAKEIGADDSTTRSTRSS